jgi:hypothetical protein
MARAATVMARGVGIGARRRYWRAASVIVARGVGYCRARRRLLARADDYRIGASLLGPAQFNYWRVAFWPPHQY